MDQQQTDVAANVAHQAVLAYREITPDENDDLKSMTDADDTIEAALRSTVIQAMADAFAGMANPVNPGQSQTVAADGGISGGGLLRDPVQGHLVGIEPAPVVPTRSAEYPKWVTPDESHVTRLGDGRPVTQGFVEQSVDRAGNITVLVNSADEEKLACSTKATPSDPAQDARDVEMASGGGIPLDDPAYRTLDTDDDDLYDETEAETGKTQVAPATAAPVAPVPPPTRPLRRPIPNK